MTRRETLFALAATPLKLSAANERINVGFIGVGGMGMSRLRGFVQHADVNPVAICDLDSRHTDRAVAFVKQERNITPSAFQDYRRLLDLQDLDAVCIATPDHWHALPSIHAFQAGKDVFVEKPLSYSIGEGRAMVKAAQRHRRISQMGNHIHNDLPNYRRVVELIRSGIVGKVDRVEVWKTGESKGMGTPADSTPPRELDYEMWLGPAPKRTFNPNRCHYTYRYFWDYSGGMFIDFFCHITDVVYWALDLTAPRFVAASGRRDLTEDNGETPNLLEVQYEYPDGVMMLWSIGRQGPPGLEDWSIGAAFQGTEGTLVTDYRRHKLFRKGREITGFPVPPQSIPDSPGHIREFLDSIKTRERCTCDVDYSHRLTKAGLLGNIAYRTGRRIEFDDGQERILNDKHADQMVTRRYRRPWRLPS
jgi:predicted dehydrogenase